MSENKSIDYGLGKTNIDTATGIRYGVIHQNVVGERWFDAAEPKFGPPTCGVCGNEAIDVDDTAVPDLDELPDDSNWSDEGRDYACITCERSFDSDDAYNDEAHSWYIDDDEYTAECGENGDIFITKSPYYTRAAFCSPCAPGAVYLTSSTEAGERAYCFGHDWFAGDKAPYPVYRVADNSLVSSNEN